MFHRLVVPTYFGGLPGGYDYINDPSANGDPGSAAFADGKKGAGPNQGTYLVAFGEDASSSNANRGLKALAENTDILDNLFHRDIALGAQTLDVLAASPVSSLVLSGQVFVGEFGVSNNQAQRDRLVSVLDNNDNEIITAGGTVVKALLIHNGSNVNVVGTQSSGFYNTPTVTLNAPIPTGTTYRVYYGERGNLATLPKDAFTGIKIRSAQEVSGEVERVLRDLHAASGANWNDAWLATINSLARTGLDGRYRLSSTSDPGGGTAMDTPGNGGFITRDGPGVRLRAPTYLLDTVGTVGIDRYPDPFLAMFKLERVTPTVTTTYDQTRGGDVFVLQESPFHNTADAGEVAYGHVTGPLVLDVVPRNIASSTLGGGSVLTRISPSTVCVVNPDALTDATSRRTIQTSGSDFFRDGSSRTALRLTDLIEVTDNTTGLVVGAYRVDGVLSATRIVVRALTGGVPPLGPSGGSANVRIRWLQPTTSIGGTQRSSGSGGVMPHFFVAAPGLLTTNYVGNSLPQPNAAFMGALNTRVGGSAPLALLHAMAWGGFGLDGAMAFNGNLYGDGSISTLGGRQSFNLVSNKEQIITLAGGATGNVALPVDLFKGGQIVVNFTNAPSVGTVLTMTLDGSTGYSATGGDEFDMYFVVPAGTTGPLSISWFVGLGFELISDGVLPATNSTGVSLIVHYRFRYSAAAGMSWRGKRVADYEG